MRSNTYTAFLGFIFFTLLNFIGLSNVHSQEEGDIFDLRFLTELDCSEDILTANIQIRTQEDSFKIGISSVLFNYDETVLAFLDYESLNFDQSNVCIPGVPLAVWDNHQFSSTTPGVFNLTLLTEIASQSCPIIERDWIDIGKIRFTVKNMEASPNMQFDTRNTTFNRNEPNDGTFAPTQGDLMGFDELLVSQCVAVCSAPTLSTDTLTFECPQTTIEANLLANDITNNPTISIVNNPTKGTASINPNGMLTYTPTTTFCGEDFLTYRVCNDDSADCCAEATVSISLVDSTLPVFVAAPADLTIECNQLTEMEDIQATDNCAIANITKSERIEAGSCPGDATHIRTWTAIDVCGNQATHTQIIALIDNEEPTIECPRTVSILCSDIGEGVIDSGQPTASDNCTPTDDLKVSFTDETISENCENFIQKQIARTWTVVDACGNFTTCIQTINVIDDIAPEINCPNDITINCGNAIAPDTLGGQPTAMDNCSAVTMSFVDDESMPDDCNFDTKIITRTWTATDACGNSTNCTQTITISGDPCSTPTTKDLTVYRCEQDIVDFKAILVEANDVIISISNSSDIPAVTDIQQYALPATGCAVGEFGFAYNIYTLEECLIESGILTIKTIPNFIGETVLSEDGCTVGLNLECPDLYTVTWNTSSDSGTGTSYTATPGTSGEVVFSVIYTADTLPNETASLPCVEKLYRVNFNCGTDCPTVANHEVSLTTCAGQNFDIAETLNLFEDSLDYIFTLADSTLGIEFGAVPSKVEIGNPFGCEMGTFNLIANGYDVNQCLVKSINIVAQVLPKIEAFVNYGTDSTFCAPQLTLECPTLYKIEWKDNLGGTGIGDTYTGANGTGGFVTFYVYPIDEDLSELPCAVDSFFADFSCGMDCPQPIERQERLTVCAESEVNIIDLLGLSENKRNTFDSDEIVDGIYKVGNPFGCELGTKAFALKCFDENQCLVEIITLNIVVIPAIYGEVIRTADVACGLFLNLECPENHAISWEDSNGNSGNGANYTGPLNTTGTVKFTVEYLTDLPILSSDSLGCFSQTFEADYNCTTDCPDVSTEERTITVCSGENLDFIEYLNLGINGEYFLDGNRLDSATNNIFGNQTCKIQKRNTIIELFDGECLIKKISITISILPDFTGSIQYVADCTPKLLLSCEDNYQVTWSDNLGNTGTGAAYTGPANTTGTVKFTVDYLTDIPILSIDSLGCFSQTFEADYNCTIDCPGVSTEERTITVCSGETLNISDYLDLSLNSEYFVNGIELDAANNYTFINGACDIKEKTFTVELFDGECLIKVISVTANILPDLIGNIQYLSDSTLCTPKLLLSCEDNYQVTWSDNLGNTGAGNIYEATEGTNGFVTFYVTPFDTLNELYCVQDTFFADFNCRGQIIDCPIPTFETIDLYGCEGETFNLFNRLQFSENTLYRLVDADGIEDIRNIRLENDGTDCFISQSRLAIDVLDELGCVTKTIFVSFNVLPKIVGELTNNEEGCGVDLTLTCPNIYAVSWVDDLGNTGEGFSYESELGTTGLVSFTVSYKDSSLVNQFIDSTCYITTFQQDFACCKPAGTACDDGDALTFSDVEDGNCECFGTGCNLEHKGKVIDGRELAGCSLLIEMSDGTILEPSILPIGETLSVGQEIIFSFVELSDFISICQSGKIVQIICLENTCPEAGTPCSDNNLATINDQQDGNCNCVGEAVPEIISEIDLRLRSELDCRANTYCLTLQAKAQREDVTIGTSSIMVNYDPDALEFASYASIQFDEKETCIGGTTSPWDEQKFDGTSVPGKFCLTMTLLTDSISCPEITTQEWEDIGIICFDIMDNDTTPNIRFDSLNTHFNSSSPNDGTRPIAIGTLHGIDTDEALGCEGNTLVATNELALKAMLQGPYKANKQLMTDDLRKRGFIPLTEPYTGIPSFVHFGEGGGEAMTLDVLGDNGDNAIVDWVFLELRSDVDSTLIVATRSALIQRDGDVVDVDGESKVQFVVPDGDYYVCLKHRNHLGVMTAAPVTFISAQTTEIDFTTAETLTYGNHAQLEVQDKMVLRGGNANPDRFIILAGGGLGLPDRDMIFFDIFLSLWQTDASIPITYNSVLHGYYGSDTNMDGKVKYQGPKNDIDAYIFFNVLFHPQNTSYRLNFAISEQIP